MRLPRLYPTAAVLIALLAAIASAEEPVLRLCADQWMPFNGEPDGKRPGYVIELARTVFEPRNIKVEYEVMSWEEALASVREARMSAAIGTDASEAEGMVLPSEPIGEVATCLMTLAGSDWTYDNIASFRTARLGVIKDYSYWDGLDAFIERKAGNGVLVLEGDDPLEDLMGKLQAGEIDVLAECEPILLWYLRSHELDRSKFRVVYKHPAEAIFVAFAPNDEGRRFASILDEGIRDLRKSGELERLLKRYGLLDWRPHS